MNLDTLSPLTIRLLLREPFYGQLLSALPKERGKEEWPLLALSGHQTLMRVPRNGPFFHQKEELASGMLKHELLHLIFGHFPLPGNVGYPGLYHLATDLVVNQYLRAEERPDNALELSLFEELQLESGRGWRYYYGRLCTAMIDQGISERLSELLWECREGRRVAVQRHRYWEKSVTAAGVEKVVSSQIRGLMREGMQATGPAALGRLPGAIREALIAAPSPGAGIDWRRALRLFASSSRRTRLKNTIRRPSKRYGTTPGIQVVRKSRLLVAVDTSASVKRETLEQFFEEIHRLWRQDYEVMIVECDVRIRRQYAYEGRPPESVSGRGGTLFDAPLAWANNHYRPDALIYFTDGAGPAPVLRCHSPLLWAIAGKEEGRHLPGRRVELSA